MARFDRLTVLEATLEIGTVPIIRPKDLSTAARLLEACRRERLLVVEVLNRGEGMLELFKELVAKAPSDYPEIILGAGTIYDAPTAAMFLEAGANFIVSPILNPEISRMCNRRKVPYLPGCGSATEISQAEELGSEICKVFPASAFNGAAFVKSILAPAPWSRLMPTNVEASQQATEYWFGAGAACVGVGGSLFTEALSAEKDIDVIAAKVREFRGWVQASKPASPASKVAALVGAGLK